MYEHAAASVANTEFNQSINVLALENNQYECELSSQLQMLGADVESEASEAKGTNDIKFEQATQDGTILPCQILQFCRESEKKLILAYRRILNEPYLAEGLRTLIRTQLNGILYAFLQLKLLNTSDFIDGDQAGVTAAR